MVNLNLNAEQYGHFLRCITNLREVCNDVDLREGMIRQRSNDKSTVFQMDLKPLLTEVNMPISDIKKKLELLKTFAGQEVSIEFHDDHFSFSDQFTTIRFMNPTLDYMDNKYITMQELETVFVMDHEELLIDTELSSMITERINVITSTFNAQAIQIIFNGEEAEITAVTQARDQFAKIIGGIVTNAILEGCSSNLSTVPFSIEHDTDFHVRLYKHPTQDVLMNKFETTIAELDVVIYGRAAIIKDED